MLEQHGFSESVSNSDPIKSLCRVLLEQHGFSESVSNSDPIKSLSRVSNNTKLQNVFVPQPPQLLAVQTLVLAVDADGNEIGQRCDQSLDSPFDPCQGQSEPLLVSLQKRQVTSFDSLRGQSAMPPVPVPGQQVDSDDEATAFFAAEPFVFDQQHDERVWATLDEGCNAACHSAS